MYQKGPFVASFRPGKPGRFTLTYSAHPSNSREADGSALCLIKGGNSENLGAWPCQGALLEGSRRMHEAGLGRQEGLCLHSVVPTIGPQLGEV